MSTCVNHEAAQAEAMCLNCQRLFCPTCLNQFGQCEACGEKFPKDHLTRVGSPGGGRQGRGTGGLAPRGTGSLTGRPGQASRTAAGPRKHRLGVWRIAIAVAIIVGVGTGAYLYVDLIIRSIPKGKGKPAIALKARPGASAARPAAGGAARGAHEIPDGDGQGTDLQDMIAKVEAAETTEEDEKRLDDLMSDIEGGKENLSLMARAQENGDLPAVPDASGMMSRADPAVPAAGPPPAWVQPVLGALGKVSATVRRVLVGEDAAE